MPEAQEIPTKQFEYIVVPPVWARDHQRFPFYFVNKVVYLPILYKLWPGTLFWDGSIRWLNYHAWKRV